MNKHLIPPAYQSELLLYALRYALGRSTYSVYTVCQVINHAWPDLSTGERELIKREVRNAIKGGIVGMEMDAEEWSQILELED